MCVCAMSLAKRFTGKLSFPLLSIDCKTSHYCHYHYRSIKFDCDLLRSQQCRPYTSASSRELPEGGLSSRILRYKKWFGFGLFGLTLGIVAYRRRKKDDADPRLPGARKLPRPLGRMKMITYKGFTIPEEVIPTVKALKDFEFREDDVVITSFPKTGVTWLQEIVWLIANDLNFDLALTSSLQDRFPFLEWPLPGIPAISAMNERRFIKTHLPPTILFKPLEEGSPSPSEVKPKVISIIRNPKDTAVSYFCFARMNKLIDFKDIFDDFLLYFLPGQVPYGPIPEHYIDVLRLQKQFEKESNKHSDQRVLIIQYEELHFHFQQEIDKICDFLGKPRLDAEKMKALQEHCSFKLMSVNRMVNYEHWDELGLRNLDEARFFRIGKVGDWQNYIDKQQDVALNKWISADFGGLFDFKFGDESFIE